MLKFVMGLLTGMLVGFLLGEVLPMEVFIVFCMTLLALVTQHWITVSLKPRDFQEE